MSTSSSLSSLSSDTVLGSALFVITAAWFARYQSKRPRSRRSNLLYHAESTDSTNASATSTTNTARSLIPRQRFSVVYNDRTQGKVGPRGQAALTPAIPYLKHFLKCLDDPCDEIDNPQGYIALCMAENKLVLDIISERFMRNSASGFSDESVYTYNSFLGMPLARESAAYFLARRFLFPIDRNPNDPPVSSSRGSRNNNAININGVSNHNNNNNNNSTSSHDDNATALQAPLSLTPEEALSHVHPSHVALAAGTASLLSNLFFLLGQEGDACLIPAPYYAAFENDMNLIAGIEPIPVPQANPVLGPTVPELEAAYIKAVKQGFHPQFVLLTNPNNPLGIIYSPSVIRTVVAWARQNNMHTIVDELYALSTHQRFGHGFQSVIKILNNQLGHDVHQIWAISKDFASSGLRVGLLYTQNEVLLEGLSTLGIFTGVSGPMQFLVAELLTDDAFVDRFLNESRARIAHSYEICIHKLEEMVIPFVPAQAGLFVYVDFSSLLPEKTFEYERQLSNLMHEYARVVLTPGESQRDALPGMFRICYAWVSPPVLIIAMERISRLVAKMRRIDWSDLGPRALASVLEK